MYALKWVNGLWSVADLRMFVVPGGYEAAPMEELRRRVADGLELYMEYSVNTLADERFTQFMETYLAVRKFVYESTGYKHDLRTVNPHFGKKNAFKKSQMRTLLYHVIVPMIAVAAVVTLLTLALVYLCLAYLLCKREKAVVD